MSSHGIPSGLRKWMAFGGGVGVAIETPAPTEDNPKPGLNLRAAAVRVRPGGPRVLGDLTIEDFLNRPAAEWGVELASFASRFSLRHTPVTVLLPRQDVIVRQLPVPGVSDKDLDGAIRYQIDSLHPWNDGDVLASWARLSGTDTALVAIARVETIGRYTTLFAEAGIKLAGFTTAAAAIYSALRLHGDPTSHAILAAEPAGTGLEVYGESPSKPLFSAAFGPDSERARALASAELRFAEPPLLQSLGEVLKAEPALPFAAALTSACPRMSLPLNLLPEEQRPSDARWRWAVTGTLATLTAAGVFALLALPGFANRSFIESLNAEIARVQPQASRAAEIDDQIAATRERTLLLDSLKRTSLEDMDVLAELTGLLAPPTWLNSLDLNREQVVVAGQTGQAAPLLQRIDASALFEASAFNGAPVPTDTGENFRIRTQRQEISLQPAGALTAAAPAPGTPVSPSPVGAPVGSPIVPVNPIATPGPIDMPAPAPGSAVASEPALGPAPGTVANGIAPGSQESQTIANPLPARAPAAVSGPAAQGTGGLTTKSGKSLLDLPFNPLAPVTDSQPGGAK